MNLGNISNKIAERVASSIGHESRPDLFISDYKTVGSDSAKVLIGYSGVMGKPNSHDINRFVLSTFDGQLIANLTNARNYPSHSVIACFVQTPKISLPIEEKKNMTAISSTSFIDHELHDTWEVSEEDNGRCLVRTSGDDIDSILATRYRAMKSHAGLTKLSAIASEQGELQLTKGTVVNAFVKGNTVEAIVISVKGNKVRIRTKSGSVGDVPRQAILEVAQAAITEDDETVEELRDFYKQFMSDEMVDKLYPPRDSAKKTKNSDQY